MPKRLEQIRQLYTQYAGVEPHQVVQLPPSGSNRRYYRITHQKNTFIGTYNTDLRENEAFFYLSKHFAQHNLPVPTVLAISSDRCAYLQNDLGNQSLLDYLNEHRTGQHIQPEADAMYQKVLHQLVNIQVSGAKALDFSKCYPRAAFDQQSVQWDLNYFKYYFLKLAYVPFDEQLLENDFQTLIAWLMQASSEYFLFRDFQSRNIMVHNNEPFFIDYQGGRRGALHYDLASLLYDSKADLSPDFRQRLFDIYVAELHKQLPHEAANMAKYFDAFVLVRMLQAFGAYGYRGLFERKQTFIQSIPPALSHLSNLLNKANFGIEIPHLRQALEYMVQSERLHQIAGVSHNSDRLHVNINSFSFMRNVPDDTSGNGGGFVFDCRNLHNPGRYEQYRHLTGKDAPVIKFFSQQSDIPVFLNHVFDIVDMTISKYVEKNFRHLMINFGCTGGQHRSVYCAERLTEHVKAKFPNIDVTLRHREQEIKQAAI